MPNAHAYAHAIWTDIFCVLSRVIVNVFCFVCAFNSNSFDVQRKNSAPFTFHMTTDDDDHDDGGEIAAFVAAIAAAAANNIVCVHETENIFLNDMQLCMKSISS